MTSIASTLLGALNAQYGLNTGVNAAKTLLGPAPTAEAAGFNLLSQTLGLGNTLNTSSALGGSLESFVAANVPNNTKLLQDVSAVNALSSMLSDELPVSSNFFNPYLTALYGNPDTLETNPDYILSQLV